MSTASLAVRAVASRGSMTTAFAPAVSCLTDTYMYTGSDFYYMSLGPPNNIQACFPNNYIADITAYYSPAISCPKGYTQACSSTEALGSVTETRATCCPSNYNCNTNFWPTALSNQVCQSFLPENAAVIYTTIGPGGVSTVQWTAGPVDAVNGYGVQIRFQNKDLTPASTEASTTSAAPSASSKPTLPSSTTPSSLSSSASSSQSIYSSSSTSPSFTSSTSPPAETSKSGLSTGARVGIGIGAAAIALIACAFAMMLWLKRRKRYETDQWVMPELGETEVKRHEMEVRPAELAEERSAPPHEMWVPAHELPAERP